MAAAWRLMQGFIAYHAGEFGSAVEGLTEMEQAFRKLPGRYFEQAFCHCFRLICMRLQGLDRQGEVSDDYGARLLHLAQPSDDQ